jgi:hypothetical protein
MGSKDVSAALRPASKRPAQPLTVPAYWPLLLRRADPTIKTFSGPDDLEGEKYEGGRDLDSIRKHAESLGPPCNIDNKENCSPEDLPMLEKYAAMSTARRDAKVVKLTNSLKKVEAEHEAVQKGLSAKFEASKAALDKLGAELKPQIKLLTAATPSKQ